MSAQQAWYEQTLPLDGAVVADVGANVGELSAFFFSAVSARGRVVSIEPLVENVAVIQARIDALGAGARWRVEACAASSREGEVALLAARMPEGIMNSVVLGDAGAGANVRRVACRRLPLLVPDATVVKVDIEGHEYELLDDALPVMTHVAAWALELHMVEGRRLSACLGALGARGYRLLAASRRPGDASGAWVSAEVPPSLEWDALPVAGRRADGGASKMMHVIALRD